MKSEIDSNGWRAGWKQKGNTRNRREIVVDGGSSRVCRGGGTTGLNQRMNDVGERIGPNVEVVKKGYTRLYVYITGDVRFGFMPEEHCTGY
jgi:hypothetical protein